MKIVSKQIQGKRAYQQDGYGDRALEDGSKILFLADGMGGYSGGEIASGIVIDSFKDSSLDDKYGDKILEEILDRANHAIKEYKKKDSEVSQMGTTLIALWIREDSYQWISVGDSILYHIDVKQKTIKRINENHSIAGLLDLRVKNGDMSAEEAKKSPNRHMLTSVMDGDSISMIDISEKKPLFKTDMFILASDGIETIDEEMILELILSCNKDTSLARDKIIKEIEKVDKKNQDNVTFMIVSEFDNIIETQKTTTEKPTVKETFKQEGLFSLESRKTLWYPLIAIIIIITIMMGIFIGTPTHKDNVKKDYDNGYKIEKTLDGR